MAPEELLAFHYDDVDPFKYEVVKIALHQEVKDPGRLGANATSFLNRIKDPQFANSVGRNWMEAGGHMHSNHPLMAAIGNIDTGLGHNKYPHLSAVYGQEQAGKAMFHDAMLLGMGMNRNLYKWVGAINGDTGINDEVIEYLNSALSKAEVRTLQGLDSEGSTSMTYLPFNSNPTLWRDEYRNRTFKSPKEGANATPGAHFKAPFHKEFHPFPSLDPTHDIVSGEMHNPVYGVGAQGYNIYSQWVHFRWHDAFVPPTVTIDPHVVFNPGNSMHPGSPNFANGMAMWERLGLAFSLVMTQANPTLFLRPAPLQ